MNDIDKHDDGMEPEETIFLGVNLSAQAAREFKATACLAGKKLRAAHLEAIELWMKLHKAQISR